MKRWRHGRGVSVFPQMSDMITFSDWDTHQDARNNSGSVKPAKKSPNSSRIPTIATITCISMELLNTTYTRSSIGGDGMKGGGLGLGHDLR